jgi:PAS domain S-box-containing protein
MAEPVRVLHVDDEPGFVELTTELLPNEDGRIEVETATSAAEGLDRLADGEIDCVVSDYDMPGTNGIEFLEAVREEYPELPFILFTGKGSEEIASDAISAGVTDYLQKKGGTDQYALLANRIGHAVEALLARERSERRKREYRTLIESSPASIIVLDRGYDILYLNPSAAETLGCDEPDDLVGTSAWQFVHPDDDEAARERVEQVFAEREPAGTREYRLITLDDTERYARGNIVPVTFEGGQAAQIVFTDVTEQKQREAALKQERERFSALFEEFPEPTIACGYENGTTIVRAVNSAFVETFGYDPDVAIGTAIKDLVVPPTEHAQQQAERLKQRVKSGEQVDAVVRRQTADSTRWFNLRNVSVPGVDDIDGYVVYADVHERVRREEQFKQLHDGTRELLGADDEAAVAETVATVAKEVLGYEYTAVRFADEDAGELRPAAATAEADKTLGTRPPYPLRGDNPHASAYEHGAPVVYDDVREADDDYDRGLARSAMYLPIGEHGVVKISALTVGAFDRSDIEIASILTANAQAALDRLGREVEIDRVRDRYQAFVEHASDIVALLDEDGIVQYQSPAAERVVGHSNEEIVGRRIFEMVHPEDRERVTERFQEMVDLETDGEPVTAEFRVRDADGDWLWIESVGGGKLPGDSEEYVVTSREITERKRREQELERYETIVEIAGDGVYTLDEHGCITFVNESLATYTGYDREELLGEPVSLLLTDDNHRRGTEIIRSLLSADEEEAVFEIEFCTREGEQIPVELNVAMLPSDDGFRGTVGVGRIITERKEREQQLERERERFSALFENFPEPTVAYRFEDGTPVVRTANEAFAETFGYDAEAVVGDSIDDLIVPPDQLSEARTLDERVQAGKLIDRQIQREAADGERCFQFRNIPCPGGEDVDGFAVYADITERVERERQLERQNERLDEFAGIVSHDLRNPLNVATAHLELAADGDDEHHAAIDNALTRIEAILDDTLDLARHGRTVLDTEPVDLRTVAEESLGMVSAETAPDGSSPMLEVVDDATVRANRGRLKQVLENLFRNSVEHGSTGSHGEDSDGSDRVESTSSGADASGRGDQHEDGQSGDDAGGVTIRVGALPDGFYVADDGPGIPASERDSVFEPGHSTVEGGAGFGLVIVREIVQAHGWEIGLADGDDGGTRFEICGADVERA